MTGRNTRKYRVEIVGRNLLVDLGAGPKKHGFVAVRFVRATSAQAAERAALAIITQEYPDAIANDPSDLPSILIEKVEEVTDFGNVAVPGTGASWWLELRH